MESVARIYCSGIVFLPAAVLAAMSTEGWDSLLWEGVLRAAEIMNVLFCPGSLPWQCSAVLQAGCCYPWVMLSPRVVLPWLELCAAPGLSCCGG